MDFLTEWSARDRGLAMGLIEAERSVDEYGIPWDVALDPERGTWLEVKPDVSMSAAAVEQWRKQHPKPEPGTVLRVVDTSREPREDATA